MAGYKDTIVFYGGLNTDDAPLYLPDGDYLSIRNNHNGTSLDSKKGFVESYDGIVEIDITLPAGNNVVIGACREQKESFQYVAVYNSNNDHCIYRVNTVSKEAQFVVKSPLLGFVPGKRITTMIVINGYLIWCQRGESLKKLHISKAYNLTNSLPDKYTAITEQILDLINWAPLVPPRSEYFNDVTINTNNIVGLFFRFAYRWVYFDGSKSTFSPWSKMPIPQFNEITYAIMNPNVSINNTLKVSVETGSEEVSKIEIAFSTDGGDIWYICKTLEKYDQAGNELIQSNKGYTFYFNNIEKNIAIDTADLIRPFDYVPRAAECIATLKDSRIAIAGCIEGFDNVDIDVSLDLVPSQVSLGGSEHILNPVRDVSFVPSPSKAFKIDLTSYQSFVSQECLFTINFYMVVDGELKYFSIYTPVGVENNSIQEVIQDIVQKVNNLTNTYGFGNACYYTAPNNYFHFVSQFVLPATYTPFLVNVKFVFPQLKTKSWKKGTHVNLGIVYYDKAGRHGDVNISDESTIYIPNLGDPNSGYPKSMVKLFSDPIKIDIKMYIKHRPPDWATKYQVVVGGNDILYTQFISSIEPNSDSRYLVIKLSEAIQASADRYLGSTLTDWSFTKGDRVQFLANNVSAGKYWNADHELRDVEIRFQDEAGFLYIDYFDLSEAGFGSNPVIQVYRKVPVSAENKYYYEVGECYDIGENLNGRYHKGNEMNQNPSSPSVYPAVVVVNSGNTYLRLREFNQNFIYPVEDAAFSDMYLSGFNDYGRVAVVNKDSKYQRYEFVRHGGRFIDNTKVNNIFQFSYSDYTEVPKKYGEICFAEEIGNVLKIIQEKKVCRVWIGVREISSPDGSTTLATMDSVFGTMKPYDDDYGCINPESIRVHNQIIYWWDQINGVVCRDSMNGVFPISNYKMMTYFKSMQKFVYENPGTEIIGGFDRKYEYYRIGFIPEGYSSARTGYDFVVFDELSNRWKHFIDLHTNESNQRYVEFMGDVNTDSLVYISGKPYIMHVPNRSLEFFGYHMKTSVKFVTNVNPIDSKTLDSIRVGTNNTAPVNIMNMDLAWSVPEILIPASTTNGSRKRSRLKAVKFERFEEHLEAEILRDLDTPMAGTEQDKLLKGDVMKGDHAIFTLEHANTAKVWLKFVEIFLSPSNLTK